MPKSVRRPAKKAARNVKAKKSVKPARKPAAKAKPKAAVKTAARPAKVVRKLISSGSAWEPKMGYSRAVRVGNTIYVSGTTAGDVEGYYAQTRATIERILAAVAPEGAKAEHVVRTRMYVLDITQWEEVARAHGEIFGAIRPATAIVEVSKLIDPKLVIEIEADFVMS